MTDISRIQLESKILIIVILVNFLVYFFVESINAYFVGDSSLYVRISFGAIISIIPAIIIWFSDKKIRKRFLLGPEYGMTKKTALDGTTFLWWLPIAVIPPGLMTGLAVKYSGFEIGRTSFGPLLMLYISFIGLELRYYYIAAKKSRGNDEDIS